MTIDLVFPAFPPALVGIGDHTARLARSLADRASVRVLTAQPDPESVPEVQVERSFSLPPRRGIRELSEALRTRTPDWLFVQFNQFSYGRWGLNPFLPAILARIRRTHPDVQIAVLFHEDFVPVTSWTNAVMTTWQRAQFWSLGRIADRVFFTIDAWVRGYRSWFPETPVDHLPVGSNIPRVAAGNDRVREALEIDVSTLVIGVFGSLHDTRLISHIRTAGEHLHALSLPTTFLYVGPDGPSFAEKMDPLPVLNAGCLPAEDVSRCFAAMDLHLAPFRDGMSTRRGSVMTALQHGIPTVSTDGPLTDPILREKDGEALLLAPTGQPEQYGRTARRLALNPNLRNRVGRGAQRLYNRWFSFDTIAQTLYDRLNNGC
jgi:glycosyltransferase involved in cell wall biosynthesis